MSQPSSPKSKSKQEKKGQKPSSRSSKNSFLPDDFAAWLSVTGDAYDSLPSSVRVGGFRFHIEVSESADSIAGGEFGHTNLLSQKIRLSPGMSNQNLANTALHECMHAIHWVFGLDDGDDEESFTLLTTNGLCAFWQDNPEFVRWFEKANRL